MEKNCCSPSYFSCFSKTSMKWWPKQDCIITQSTAPGRLISVARKTMSSPGNVVIDLCRLRRWGMTCSRGPCHLHYFFPLPLNFFPFPLDFFPFPLFSIGRFQRIVAVHRISPVFLKLAWNGERNRTVWRNVQATWQPCTATFPEPT